MMARVGPTQASESLIERMDSFVAAGPGLTTSGPGLPGPGAHSIHPLPLDGKSAAAVPVPVPVQIQGVKLRRLARQCGPAASRASLGPAGPRWRSAAADPESDSLCMGTECCSIAHPVGRDSAAGH